MPRLADDLRAALRRLGSGRAVNEIRAARDELETICWRLGQRGAPSARLSSAHELYFSSTCEFLAAADAALRLDVVSAKAAADRASEAMRRGHKLVDALAAGQ